MNKPKVQWTEFDQFGYDVARKAYGDGVCPTDFEKTLEGEVIHSYTSFWGTPKFVVSLPDGHIKTIAMDSCKFVKDEPEN